MRFSDEQEKAIKAEGSNYLISAGAGSGKTAVLTERIYRIAKRENTLDKFLVLTFTNLAAAEMKTRVRNKLLDDDSTIHLASEVDNAHIETFDSFYLYLAKKYFYELGISKNPNIVDSSILIIKRKMFLDQVFEELCDKKDEGFVGLIYSYCVKNESTIKDFVIRVLNMADRKGDKYEYLDYLKTAFFNEDIISTAIESLYREFKDNIRFLEQEAAKLQDINDANNILVVLESFDDASDYDSLYEKLKLTSMPRKPKSDADDGEFRDSLKSFFDNKIKITAKNNDYGTSKDIANQYMEIKPYVEEIIDIAKMVEERLDAFKLDYNAFSFGDISRFVLKLLKNDAIREEIKNTFDYIMVDEYQDTNSIQDSVIKAISKDNVYMVGDVKQSIYRFRGADCQIFQEKYDDYKKHIGGEEIDLNRSYRSRKEVVDFVNEVFSKLMKKEYNAIDYQNGHHFEFGRDEYEINKPTCSYKPEVYNYSYQKSSETPYIESELIAKDILTKINQKYEVFVGKNETRKCSYKDFAIIIDRGTDFNVYRKTLAQYNIPLKVESKETLFGSDIVSVLRNLVKLLYYSLNSDYSTNYKHAYFSVARSFLFEYPDDKLYDVHSKDAYLLEPFAQQIELMKESLRFASIKKVMSTLVEKFDIYSSISKIANFYANAHKIENIISISETMDMLGYRLEDFVNYFDELAEQDIDIEYKDSDAQEDSVTLLNIHASKGLEYNIIYYPGIIKKFNDQDQKTSYLISDKYGMVLPSTMVKAFSSPFIHLIKEELRRADFEEKIRLLYVAITRAKEKIIILNGNKEKGDGLVKPTDSTSFKQMLNVAEVFDNYSVNYKFDYDTSIKQEEDKVVEKINLKTIHIPAKIVERRRASKEVDEEIDQSVLDFGTTVHALLEHMDLESDDLSYVKDSKMRRYVQNVKNSWLLKGLKNSDVRHEFPFYDETNGTSGFIDLLILRKDEIDIIDFKLKNINDEEYDKQLITYKQYLKTITPKKIRMFLLSAITGEIREVQDE